MWCNEAAGEGGERSSFSLIVTSHYRASLEGTIPPTELLLASYTTAVARTNTASAKERLLQILLSNLFFPFVNSFQKKGKQYNLKDIEFPRNLYYLPLFGQRYNTSVYFSRTLPSQSQF
jgi:hypothetical protein